MKKWKLLPLLLAIALVIALLPPVSLAVVAQAEENEKELDDTQGLVLNKTATYGSQNKDFLITLEAYVTGELFLGNPVDVVLVLDQSGSMAYCIGCGEKIENDDQTHATGYNEVYTVDTNSKYYIKYGDDYVQVEYCNGTHTSSFPGGNTTTKCEGGEGWYVANTGARNHTKKSKLTPKTSSSTTGTQFYEAKTEKCTPRKDALVKAAESFVKIVKEKAAGKDGEFGTNDDVKHRVAVVGFGSAAANSNTELLSIDGGNSSVSEGTVDKIGKAYYKQQGWADAENLTVQDYKNGLQYMTEDTGRTKVDNAIKALDANGATRIDLGMKMAENIFKNNEIKEGEGRKRIVVVLTDGSPTTGSVFSTMVADNAIGTAETLKNTYKATVYGIGLFEGANAEDLGSKPTTNDYNWDGSLDDGKEIAACNWFMQNLSSNNGTKQNPSYYLSTHSEDKLTEIFEKIANGINGGADAKLTSEAIVKDIIAPQFQLPEGTEAKGITIKSYPFTGMGKDGESYVFSTETNDAASGAKATVDSTDGTVSVTGFDFSSNWCGMDKSEDPDKPTAHGSKLVISFHVKPKDGFLGGNDVYTNTEAKIYQTEDALKNNKPIGTFPTPKVNVPIKDVTVTAADKNVYLLGGLTADQIKSGVTAKCGNVNIDLSRVDDNYGLAAWQTEYVNIEVKYTDATGNTVTDLKDLKDDTTYTVTVTVSPKTNGSSTDQGTVATAKTGNATGKINVFKPELTFKDSKVWYGDTAPTDYSGNYEASKTVWKHDNTASTDVTMIGDKPELSLSYDAGAGIVDDKIAVKTDIPVDVTVKIGETDVTDKTAFKHTNCADNTCNVPEGKEFLLHVKTCQLTITKAAGKDTTIGDDEYFVFTVKKDGENYTQVTIKSTGSETISELPVGTYTIEEDTSVAWRYSTPTYSAGATLSSTNPKGSLTCTNTKTNNSWLNDFTRAINTYGSQTPTIDGNIDGN